MTIALLIARLALALVFLVAGVSKLVDLPGSRQAMREFGVPEPLAPSLGLALPLAELAVAAALIPVQSAWAAAIAALVLLGAFIAGIGANLLRGRRPYCHCFGQIYSQPVGIETLLRNAVLLAIAAFIAGWGRGNAGAVATDWLAALSPPEAIALGGVVIGLAMLAAQWWLLLNLMRMQGRLLLRVEALEGNSGVAPAPSGRQYGLPAGADAPDFALPDLDGAITTLADLTGRGEPVLLVFVSPSCGPCAALAPELGRWQAEDLNLTVAVISSGSREENRGKYGANGISTLLLQRSTEVAEAYQSPGTPSAVLVGPDGKVASPMAAGADDIRRLVATPAAGPDVEESTQVVPLLDRVAARSQPTHAASGRTQPQAPAIRLPDVQGTMVDLADFRGSETIILFWNPGCNFCQRMLPELQAWERSRHNGDPRLLVVSAGAEDEVRAIALSSPVVHNPDNRIAGLYGATGTPMAVLIDEHGLVASPVVAGAEAVLSLARGASGL